MFNLLSKIVSLLHFKYKHSLTFVLRERHLPLLKVSAHLSIMAHLQHQIHIVAVFKVVVQLQEDINTYNALFIIMFSK